MDHKLGSVTHLQPQQLKHKTQPNTNEYILLYPEVMER